MLNIEVKIYMEREQLKYLSESRAIYDNFPTFVSSYGDKTYHLVKEQLISYVSKFSHGLL